MHDRNVGSLLVVSADWRAELIGIFTERDLLKRLTDIRKNNAWEKTVSWVMSKPVHVIESKDLKKAPRFMLDKGIRHLPIVDTDSNGYPQLSGVISMRDLFRQLVEESESFSLSETVWNLRSSKPLKVGVMSDDDAIYKLVKSASRIRGSTELRKLKTTASQAAESNLGDLDDLDALVIDFDRGVTRSWLQVLTRMAGGDGKPRILLVLDPSNHSKATLSALEKLAERSKRFALFSKPIDALALQRQLSG